MRVVRLHEYGGPEVLRLEEVERPAPGPRDVLIKVMATAVNPVDWKIRSGGQRSIIRYRLPWILGLDVSGVVEAVGAEVTTFRAGDEVWSSPRHTRPGTYAEYVAVDAAEVSLKPRSLSHVEAASLPLVGLTSSQPELRASAACAARSRTSAVGALPRVMRFSRTSESDRWAAAYAMRVLASA